MIKFDCKNVDARVIGDENGLNLEQEFNNYSSQIAEIITDLNRRKDKPGEWLQWMNLGYSEETAWYVKEYAAMVEGRFDNILVLGIGGSSLGGMAVAHSLLDPYWNSLSKEERRGFPKIFFLDNIEPDSIISLLNHLDLAKTLVNVITKSGDTLETMAQYMIVKDILEKELGDDYRKNIVATTDMRTGILRQIAEQEGYKTFVVPEDVGGRYSVFSAVGLLPFALVGIDINEILSGVRDIDIALKNPDIHQNIAAQNALIHYLMDVKKGKKITVMMPYSSRLKFVPDWFAHLWGESLGKNIHLDGSPCNIGLTTVKAVGVTDQYSQLQLYNEGPNDKVINIIRIDKFKNELQIPKIFEYTGIGYLGGKTMNELMNAEADSITVSLSDNSRPSVTITLPEISAYYIAQLLYMLEVQTAVAGALYNVNPFNQPGVEQSKNYTYAIMGRAGYEDSEKLFKSKMALMG